MPDNVLAQAYEHHAHRWHSPEASALVPTHSRSNQKVFGPLSCRRQAYANYSRAGIRFDIVRITMTGAGGLRRYVAERCTEQVVVGQCVIDRDRGDNLSAIGLLPRDEVIAALRKFSMEQQQPAKREEILISAMPTPAPQ
jgi:hypothetical protein